MKVVSLTKLGLDTIRRAQRVDNDEMRVLDFLEKSHYRSTDDEIDRAVPHSRMALEKLLTSNLVVYL